MKLITKNFTGFLPFGERYRVILEDEKNKVYENRVITASLQVFDTFTDRWTTSKVVCVAYSKSEQYKTTLKQVLIEAENKFGIQLLKSEMQIAV